MSARHETVTTHRALASERRQALLELLRHETRPIDALEAARAIGLHRNTARVHLDVLVSSHLAERILEVRTIPGRPRVLYRIRPATSDHPTSDADYRGLAGLLASQLSERPDVREIALRAGRRWASALEAESLATGEMSSRDALDVVTALLDSLGFEAEPGVDCIRLHRCPFGDVAREHRSVVCAVHLGMLTSTFDHLHTSLSVAGLDPFVSDDPLLCVVRLRDDAHALAPANIPLTETSQP
ncbi:MAG: hypothetical protein KGJ39_08775 [Acidobacteriota bacterium]|nr:hypothetical protein [Acidobacteriota bacterium]